MPSSEKNKNKTGRGVRNVYTLAFIIALLEYGAILCIAFTMYYFMSKGPSTPVLQGIRLSLPIIAIGIIFFDFRFKYRDFKESRKR